VISYLRHFSNSQLEQRIGLPTQANDGLASCITPVTQRALRIKLAGPPAFQLVPGRVQLCSLYTAKIEKLMNPDFLGPLETVDLHDPPWSP
jgi:hypothetical protein